MSKPYTNETYFKKVSEKYNNKFIYYNDFIKIKADIKVGCPLHGIFELTADKHLHGKDGGCKKCQLLKRKLIEKKLYGDLFLQKVQKIHGNRYNYSKVDYVNNHTDVIIVCSKHGDFPQSPSSHLNGRGCRECGKETMGGYGGYNYKNAEKYKNEWINKDAFIYIVRLYNENEDFIKIGISVHENLKIRFLSTPCPYNFEKLNIFKMSLYDAVLIEQNFLNNNKNFKYTPEIKFNGYTECYNILWKENIKNILLEELREINYSV